MNFFRRGSTGLLPAISGGAVSLPALGWKGAARVVWFELYAAKE